MTNNLAPRLYGWINSYGLDYAIKRAERSMAFYRRIYLKDIELLDKDKSSVLTSYLEMKEFLRTKEVNYEPKESEVYKRLSQKDGDNEVPPRVQTTEEESKESVQKDDEK